MFLASSIQGAVSVCISFTNDVSIHFEASPCLDSLVHFETLPVEKHHKVQEEFDQLVGFHLHPVIASLNMSRSKRNAPSSPKF